MKLPRAPYPVDLHCHTTRSDGADTPLELIDRAAARGMRVIAMTDHDLRPARSVRAGDGEEISLIGYAAAHGVKLLPGIEISCDTDVEDVHIVGLGCNWDDPFFAQLEQEVARSKLESYRVLVEALAQAGYPIGWQELLEQNEKAGKSLQKKQIFELLAAKGCFGSWSEAKLMTKRDSRFRIRRRKPRPEAVIEALHAAGGVAILAHPFLITPLDPQPEDFRGAYIDTLLAAGIDAMEASYPYGKTSYHGSSSAAELEALVRRLYAPRLRFLSGGSDYHADFKRGVQNAREIGECGLSYAEYLAADPLRTL